MATQEEQFHLGEIGTWAQGPPHDEFKRMRAQCPVNWTEKIEEYPEEAGYWSVTTADDIHAVSRDWETFSSAYGVTALTDAVMPLSLIQAMFIGMDPPKHDRLKNLFQRGFTPKRIAEHEDEIRAIAQRVVGRLEGREEADLMADVAVPVVARVIGSFMGIAEEDDETWARIMNAIMTAGDTELHPEGIEVVMQRDVPEMFERCKALIAERRENPTDDLTSVLVHAEVDGEVLTEEEIVMGFFLLMAAGNDSTRATYCSGMLALLQDDAERAEGARRPVARPRRRRGVAADVPGVLALPAHGDARHRARRPDDPQGRQGRALVRLVQPRRVGLRGPRPLQRHAQPRAPGVRRGRPALLPRHRARAPGAVDPVRGDARALPGDAADRRSRATSSRRSSTSSRRCASAWASAGAGAA